VKNNIFLAALPSHDNRLTLTQKILACEAKRSPLTRVHWTHTQDLHLTIGFIPAVDQTDLRTIALSFVTLAQNSPIMVTVEDIRLYGNAIVLRVEPIQTLHVIHKTMNQKLIEATNNKYQFQVKGRFDPHLTVGRVKNLSALNPQHKHQLMSLVEQQCKGYSFLIQQVALMHRLPEKAVPAYQSIQLYTFRA
jgi:2'-5' RNA ligase